jgi:hypothetical protein
MKLVTFSVPPGGSHIMFIPYLCLYVSQNIEVFSAIKVILPE